jgi:Leu/Phe-tRNA-protein transferase
MVTPLLKSFGGEEVSKNEFRKIVETSTILEDDFFDRLSGD